MAKPYAIRLHPKTIETFEAELGKRPQVWGRKSKLLEELVGVGLEKLAQLDDKAEEIVGLRWAIHIDHYGTNGHQISWRLSDTLRTRVQSVRKAIRGNLELRRRFWGYLTFTDIVRAALVLALPHPY